MIKVLQISMGEAFGGVEKEMMKVSSKISNIDFHFLTPVEVFKNNDNVYNLNVSRNKLLGKIKYNFRLYKFLRKNSYDIVHINSGVFLYSFQVAFIAKLAGVKKVIAHSHSVPKMSILKKIIKILLNPIYNIIIDLFLACSNDALKSLTNNKKKSIILKNGIDVSKFRYNEKIRSKERKKLNISDNVVVYGHVGRFDENKNQEFLIDVFNLLCKKNSNSILLLVGSGETLGVIKEKVKSLKLSDKVLFLGYQEDVTGILNAMDKFIFPSKSEGMGIVVIEAIATGLVTFVSDGVPNEVMISNNCIRINNYDAKLWSDIIFNTKIRKRDNCYKDIIKNNYDIDFMSNKLNNIYKELIK